MARKRHSDEDILKLLREIELHLAGGADVATACRAAGVSFETFQKLQERKLLLAEKMDSEVPEEGSFDETCRTALRFLANPCKLWDLDDSSDRNLFLKLVFRDKLPYHGNNDHQSARTT